MGYKSGFVTVLGRPNVGKSTLLNNIIGEKVSIISNKPQTTRNKIQCVHSGEDYQVVFIDTPGVQKPRNKLGEYMKDITESSLKEVDVIVLLVDNSKSIGPGDKSILEQLKQIKTDKILVINKIDKLNKDEINYIIEIYKNYDIFKSVIPLSALNGTNVDNLVGAIKNLLPEGPQYFPSDMITDQPERNIISEIIREKSLHFLDEEVPHGIAVDIDSIRSREEQDIVDISATIYCEKDSHKGIIIGKGGKKLKGIGKSARLDIERLLGSKVYLDLWVKVNKNWREKEKLIRKMGYKR